MRRSAPRTKNWMTAGLAISVVAGYLLTSGALDPVLGDAVTFAEGAVHRNDAAPPAGTELKTSKVADWQYFDDTPEWSSVRQVPAVQRPADPAAPSRPAVAPPEDPIHFHFSAPTPMRRYGLKPMPSCFQPRGMGLNVERLTAIPIAGGAKVTWWDLGDPDTASYQIAIIPVGTTGNPIGYTPVGAGTPITFINVPAPKTCKGVAVTIPGLRTGDAYRFFLLAMNRSPEQNGRKYRPTRGETETVTVL
jgi:hypothetical protein